MALKDKLMTLEDFKAVRDVDVASNSAQFTEIKAELVEPDGVGIILLPGVYNTNNQVLFTKNDVAPGTIIHYKITVSTSAAWISFKNDSDTEIYHAYIGKKSSNSQPSIYENKFTVPSDFDHATIRTVSGSISVSYFVTNWFPSKFYNYALKSIGNSLPNGVTKLEELPVNSVLYLTGTALNALEDVPESSTNGAIIITINGVADSKTGMEQQVIYWGSGRRYIRSYTNSAFSPWRRYAMYEELSSSLVVHPNGLIGNITTYTDLNNLPLNSIMTFYSSAITSILHKPDNVKGVFTVLTLGCEESNYTGAIQILLSLSTEMVIMYRTYISGVWKTWKTNQTAPIVVSVRSDGTGDYSSVVNAIVYTMHNPTTENIPYIIDIGEGTFDISDAATLVLSQEIDHRGLFVMPYTSIVGKGRDKTKLIFDYNGNSDDVMSQVSAFNVVYEGSIRDMTIECKNIRYVFHADYPMSGESESDSNELLNNNTFTLENVVAIHSGFDDGLSPSYKVPAVWGQGLRTGLVRNFINCKFVSLENMPWFCHDRTNITKGSQLFFDGCEFITENDAVASLRFVSWGSNYKHIVNIKNSLVRTFISLGVSTAYNNNAKIDYFVEAGDIDAVVVEDTTNDAHKANNYYSYGTLLCKNTTGTTVTKNQPVKIRGYNKVVNNSNNGIQGIALHDAGSGDMVNVKISGAVNIATSITAGKRISYNNGNWVEDVNGYLIVMNSTYCRFVN